MGLITRLASGAAVLAMALVTWPAAASAAPADGGLGLDIRTARPAYEKDEPVRLTFAVTNATGTPCGLAKAAEGTIQVMSVRRDGQELFPALGRSFYLDGLDNAIAASVVAAEPGATVDVELASARVHDGTEAGSVVLRSVAASPGGGGLDALWPVGAPGRYEVTAGYAVPAVNGAASPCTGFTSVRTVAFTIGEGGGFPWLWIAVGGVLVLAVGVLVVVVLVRRRKPAVAAAVALVLIGLGAIVGTGGRPAYADYSIDPTSGIPVPGDFAGAVEGCLAGFAKPGGDPAGILPRLKDKSKPNVRIVPTTGESGAFETPNSPDGKGSSSVAWNPTSKEAYSDGVPRDPCAALYHELSHADDISKDKVPEGDCGDTKIPTAEVKATFAENKYRKGQPNMKPRTEYKGNKLPKSLDDCKKPKKPTPPETGPKKLCEGTGTGTCASTNGDPHLMTFDRAYYDFQAVGEFVVVRSTAGDALEVQARQAPMGPSRTVSVNSAVAFRLGDHRVSLALDSGVTRVRVDGEVVDVPRGEKALPGGGVLERRESDLRTADGYDLRWPDGSGAAVDQIGGYGYRLLLKLDKSRSGKVQGLLGDFDGDPDNDIAPPSGPVLAQPVPFDKLYPSYADSWRVAQDSSMFAYAAGQSTQTFTDRAFPDKPVTLADLDAGRRAQAEEICRWAGLTSGRQFLECVFDVAATGRSEFAVSSASTELLAPATEPITAKPIASGTLTAGSGDRLTFAGHTGDAVFVDITAPTLPDQCSPYLLLDPSGKEIADGCNINGVGHIDRTELTMDGQYAVTIKAHDGDTGRANMRVYAAKDTTGTLEPNGAPVSAAIEQPGALARYTFTGTAGQRVYVEVPESTLRDQCSPLELIDKTGRRLNSGCVINGVGEIDGTLLPADDTYTVLVDANDRSVGTIQLRLFAAKDQTAAISLDGRPVVVTVGQPGAVMRYQFSGTAGTSVTLTATDATLPDQCSPLELLDPTGKRFTSGCVINGTGGIDRTELPATGTYTVVVDPNGPATGAVTLSLRS